MSNLAEARRSTNNGRKDQHNDGNAQSVRIKKNKETEAAVIALQTNAREITTADGIADDTVLKLLGI